MYRSLERLPASARKGLMETVIICSFDYMEAKLPVKSLRRLNWISSIVISSIIHVYLQLDNEEDYRLLYTIMTFLTIAAIGFINILLLVKLGKRMNRKSCKYRFYHYFLSYVAAFGTYLVIYPIFAELAGEPWSAKDLRLFLTFLISSALINTLVVIFQGFIVLQAEKAQSDLEISRLKIAHSEAANMLLKQQIHPHFLFNALNTLKSLYRMDTRSGDKYIVHLANFLRASIFNHGMQVTTVQGELDLLHSYLEMQSIRFGDALFCTIDIPERSLAKYFLPSFCLQPLLENAIKHNEFTEELPLKVSIAQDGDRLVIKNNLQPKTKISVSTNSGLANLAERYRIWSGDTVIIHNDNKEFLVSIKLLDNENSYNRR